MKKLLILAIILLISVDAIALPAFPGAQGMGAASVGGRGGSVIKVTNLNDSGDGSFRAAVTTTGARYIVFTVSGIIELQSNVIIDDPYITIAGETSPGGVMIYGSQVNVNTHDVIVRHMRFRIGQKYITSENAEQVGDSIEIGAYDTTPSDPPDQYNIIFDHCSFAWGIDETVSVVCNSSDITFSWCLFGPGCYVSVHPESPHGAGFISWGRYAINQRVSIHHSVFVNNSFRNPENNYNSFIDATNNVVFGHETTRTWEITNISGYTATANAIGCYTRTDHTGSTGYGRTMYMIDYTTSPSERIYMTGCLDGTRTSQLDDQWSVQTYWMDADVSTSFQRLTAWPTTGYSGNGIAVSATTMSSGYAQDVVSGSGAFPEDDYDTSLKASYTNTAINYTLIDGVDVDTTSEVEALVGTYSGSYPTDSDNDGMSDTWELATFGDLDQTATTDFDSDGYTDIEEYFHYLAEETPTYDNPIVTILTESGSTTSETITIIGTLVTDTELTGTGVTVNGVTATADDGTFDEASEAWTALGVSLSLGANTITATGTDSDSATDQDSISYTRAIIKESKINGAATLKNAVIHQ